MHEHLDHLGGILLFREAYINEIEAKCLPPTVKANYVVFILFTALVLTQVSNNTVVIVLFATIVYSMANKMGYNPVPVFLLLTCMGNAAVCTPAASIVGGIGFSNEWLTTKDAVKYGVVECIVTFIVCLVVGIPFGNIIF